MGSGVRFRNGEPVKKMRRNHAPEFKAKVALEAAREETTITELSRKYGLHANQIRAWTEQLVAGAVGLFTTGGEIQRNQDDYFLIPLIFLNVRLQLNKLYLYYHLYKS